MMQQKTSGNRSPLGSPGQRIVVLGGLGFLGSHICRALVARGYEVRIFDKLYGLRTLVEDIEAGVEILESDISRPDDVLAAISDAEIVVNLVHTTVPGSSMKDAAYDVSSNVLASVKWLSRLGETKVKRIFYVSSGGTVYGNPQTQPITETHPTEPVSSYGITKLSIEKYVAMYADMFGVAHRILRPSNVYGEGQRLNIGQGVIGVLADRALRGEPLEVWGTGEALRDYLHVDDLVAAMVSLLDYSGPHCVFNVSSGTGRSVLDIINALQNQAGLRVEVKHLPDRGFDVAANVLSSSRLRTETGWAPAVEFEAGIARTVKWLRELDKH
jgi:UDP-glucose 4-epimerase